MTGRTGTTCDTADRIFVLAGIVGVRRTSVEVEDTATERVGITRAMSVLVEGTDTQVAGVVCIDTEVDLAAWRKFQTVLNIFGVRVLSGCDMACRISPNRSSLCGGFTYDTDNDDNNTVRGVVWDVAVRQFKAVDTTVFGSDTYIETGGVEGPPQPASFDPQPPT